MESFFASKEALILEVEKSNLSPANVAMFQVPWGNSLLQIEVQVEEDQLLNLPMKISVVPAQLEAFMGRNEDDFQALARQDLAKVLTSSRTVPICGNRKLVAQGPAQWSAMPQSSNVLFGFAMLQGFGGEGEPVPVGDEDIIYSEGCFEHEGVEGDPGNPGGGGVFCSIGTLSIDCPLAPGPNCRGACRGLWFTGNCAPGRNLLGFRVCGCF